MKKTRKEFITERCSAALQLSQQQFTLEILQEKLNLQITRATETTNNLEEGNSRLIADKAITKQLKKDLSDMRFQLDQEITNAASLRREINRKQKQIDVIHQEANMKQASQAESFTAILDRISRTETVKREELENQIKLLNAQIDENNERFQRQKDLHAKAKFMLEEELQEEFSNGRDLKRKNRELEREIKRTKFKYEEDMTFIRSVLSKTNYLWALSFVKA